MARPAIPPPVISTFMHEALGDYRRRIKSATRDASQHAAYNPANSDESEHMEKAVFAAGCFWGVESFFREVPGVADAISGYAGGTVPNPSYKQVCSGTTGHAEAVEVTYDPTVVSYDQLLDVYFTNHDPTTPNRQGPDVGSQYRSVIFAITPEQDAKARRKIEQLTAAKRFKRPIVTAVEPFRNFYRAEEYHQRYFEKNGLPSCHVQIPD
jgi:peptide-methionine (S)-S-oxide reductase